MINTGVVFDIKEFALNDGPGVRVTVFLKGCPLKCCWCHNPEGMKFESEINYKTGFVIGREWNVDDLVKKIYSYKGIFDLSGGGVTFSGGEPLAQFDFLYQICRSIGDVHKTIETSGQISFEKFKKILSVVDLVFFDLKILDRFDHKKYTGVFNDQIVENFNYLSKAKNKYHLRIPLIPGITDTEKNISELNKIIMGVKNKPESIDFLSYNRLAGGKYGQYNRIFTIKSVELLNIDYDCVNKYFGNYDNVKIYKN